MLKDHEFLSCGPCYKWDCPVHVFEWSELLPKFTRDVLESNLKHCQGLSAWHLRVNRAVGHITRRMVRNQWFLERGGAHDKQNKRLGGKRPNLFPFLWQTWTNCRKELCSEAPLASRWQAVVFNFWTAKQSNKAFTICERKFIPRSDYSVRGAPCLAMISSNKIWATVAWVFDTANASSQWVSTLLILCFFLRFFCSICIAIFILDVTSTTAELATLKWVGSVKLCGRLT